MIRNFLQSRSYNLMDKPCIYYLRVQTLQRSLNRWKYSLDHKFHCIHADTSRKYYLISRQSQVDTDSIPNYLKASSPGILSHNFFHKFLISKSFPFHIRCKLHQYCTKDIHWGIWYKQIHQERHREHTKYTSLRSRIQHSLEDTICSFGWFNWDKISGSKWDIREDCPHYSHHIRARI